MSTNNLNTTEACRLHVNIYKYVNIVEFVHFLEQVDNKI